jgi:hypothetical protein
MTLTNGRPSENGRRKSEILDREPPHDGNAERGVLAGVLLKPELIGDVADELRPSDFHDVDHQKLFRAMLALRDQKRAVDITLLGSALQSQGEYEEVGGAGFIAELYRLQPSAAYTLDYVRVVKQLAGCREIIHAGLEAVQSAYNRAPAEIIRRRLDERLAAAGALPQPDGLLYAPTLIRLADVQPEPVQWLWPGRIALGKVTLIAGDPGLGKSFLTLDLAARVTLGVDWPDDRSTRAPLGGVVLLNAEDDLADTVRPRLDAAGADVSRIIALASVKGRDPNDPQKHFSLERDLPALERAIVETPDCKLVVIDPITAYLGEADSHKNADIRGLLAPLAELAGRHGVAIVAVTHLNKSAGGKAMYRTMGSLAFVAAARAAWAVAKDKANESRRLFLPMKNNLAADVRGMAYSIIDGMIAWEATPVDTRADDALTVDPPNSRGSDRDAAAEWLLEALSDGPLESTEVFRQGKENGFSEKTLRRAAKQAGVACRKAGFGGAWHWHPQTVGTAEVGQAGREDCQDGQQNDVAIFG